MDTYYCPQCKRRISEEEYIEEQEEAGTGGYCYCQFHNERTLINMIKFSSVDTDVDQINKILYDMYDMLIALG